MSNILSYQNILISPKFQDQDRSNLQIYVKSENYIAIKVNKSERIIDVKSKFHEIGKKKIQENIGNHSDEQKLIYQSRILEEDKTVEECKIVEKCSINILRKFKGGIQIFVKTLDGKIVTLKVHSNEKISDVKIQEKLGLDPDDQKLFFQGGILQDDKTVDYYGIVDKSVINIVVRLRGGMQIFVKSIDSKTLVLEVHAKEKISDVKKKIQEKLGLHPDKQKLIFLGKVLQDDKTVEQCGIGEECSINLVPKRKYEIQIFVRTLDGRTVAFVVSKNEIISDVKKKVQEKLGLHPDEQNLVFQGGILQDHATVEQCGIVDKSTINIVVKLRGGIQIFVKKKIQDKLGLHPDKQKLIFQRRILQDDATVEECGIVVESVLDVVASLPKFAFLTRNYQTPIV